MSSDTDNKLDSIAMEEPLLKIKTKKESKKTLNLASIIKEKRKEIQKLYINNLGVSKYWKAERKPSPLRRLEEGLTKIFFKDDRMLNRFPGLRRELRKNEHKKDNVLNTKIDIGPLVYLYMQNTGSREQARMTELKSRTLKSSNNYAVPPDKDMLENEIQKLLNENKEKNNTISVSKDLFDKNTFAMINNFRKGAQTSRNKTLINDESPLKKKTFLSKYSRNSKRTETEPKLINLKNTLSRNRKSSTIFVTPSRDSKIIPRIRTPSLAYSNTEERVSNTPSFLFRTTLPIRSARTQKNTKVLSFSPRKSQHSFSSLKSKTLLSKFPRHNMVKSIMTKASSLQDHTNKIDGQLYKIIDSLQYNKVQDTFKQKDLEEIYDMKIKKKKDKGHAKEQVIQAVKVKDDYTLMDSDKAAMIKLSDDITKMPDEVALAFADRIAEAYYDRSDKVGNNEYVINPFIEKIKLRNIKKLREKTDNNNDKIHRMGVSLELKERQLKLKYGRHTNNSSSNYIVHTDKS